MATPASLIIIIIRLVIIMSLIQPKIYTSHDSTLVYDTEGAIYTVRAIMHQGC